jgi:hypothetical protein
MKPKDIKNRIKALKSEWTKKIEHLMDDPDPKISRECLRLDKDIRALEKLLFINRHRKLKLLSPSGNVHIACICSGNTTQA